MDWIIPPDGAGTLHDPRRLEAALDTAALILIGQAPDPPSAPCAPDPSYGVNATSRTRGPVYLPRAAATR